MRKYKVKIGSHVQDDHEYKAGDVVTTSMNLTKMFPEKFEDLGPVTPSAPSAAPAASAPAPETARQDSQPPIPRPGLPKKKTVARA